MSNKHKVKKVKSSKKNKSTSLFTKTSDNTSVSNVLNYKVEKKLSLASPVNNSYPFGSLGYNFPTPNYSVQKLVRPDDNKYFHNYKYNYNVQSNKPVMTYDQYMYKQAQKAMTPQEYRYYQQFNQKYFYYNGNYELQDHKPVILAVQASLNYPTFSGGSALENNSQVINAQTAQISQPIPNSLSGQTNYVAGIGGSVQIYGNSPAYTGVQAKTLPGQNIMINNANNANNVNNMNNANANVYNMAYGYDSE
jgi:hypothetical protein